MPPTGGSNPLNQSIEEYQQEQRKVILNSDGFKLAIAGTAITILTLILLIRNYMLEELLQEERERRIVPYPPPIKVKAKPIEEIIIKIDDPKPIQSVITHELSAPMPPRMIMPPRMPIPLRITTAPRVLTRNFKYPPPYHVLNKN